MSWAHINARRSSRGRCSLHPRFPYPCKACRARSEAEARERARSTLTLLARFAVFMWMEAESNHVWQASKHEIAFRRAFEYGLLRVTWGTP